jgi:monovalent cation/proton antiporter MnhG/PhaG subunit
MHHPEVAAILVGIASVVAIACSLGLAIVKNSFERLHFSSAVTSLCAALITVAVWLDDPDWQSRIKVALVAIVLFFMNSILSHATARAIRVRENKQLEPRADEKIMRITLENPTGAGD